MSGGRHRPTLGEAVAAALAGFVEAPLLPGIKTPITRKVGLRARMNALEKAHRGDKAAAAAAGVKLATWRGWKAGKTAPARASLAKVERAYQEDLRRRSQTPARKRAEAVRLGGAPQMVAVKPRAEWQVDGYYNGQVPTVAASAPQPPLKSNTKAHRSVRAGQVDISRVMVAWGRGDREEAGRELERAIGREWGSTVFLNTYYHGATVRLG